MRSSLDIQLAGEAVTLNADGTAYWPRKGVLWVADVHLGKAASFRSLGVPVPGGTTRMGLGRLERAIHRDRPEELVILGDLWHSPRGLTPEICAEVTSFASANPGVRVTLVGGNHDLKCRAQTERLGIEWVDEWLCGPFRGLHHPSLEPKPYELAGHIHPAARMEGRGLDGGTFPCFWQREQGIVLPAFGEFTGCATIRPAVGERVYVLVANAILAAPAPLEAA